MRHILTVAVAVLFAISSFAVVDKESEYLAARDKYRAQFKKNPDLTVESEAMKELDAKLVALLGVSKIKGFSAPHSRIDALADHHEEECYDAMDGLIYYTPKAPEQLFVTTTSLAKKYQSLKTKKTVPFEKRIFTDDFYNSIFGCTGSGVTIYSELPLTSAKDFEIAHAFLALDGQDIGPFSPNTLLVTAVRNGQMLVLSRPLKDAGLNIAACTTQWDNDQKKNKGKEAEEKSFESFRQCYKNSAKEQPFYPRMKEQAQKGLELLAGK